MQVFNTIPLSGFLFILTFLITRIGFLRKKGIVVSKNQRSKKKSTILLYPVFGIIFLIWFFEIIKPAFQLSNNIFHEILTMPVFESKILKISGTALILLSLILWTITLIHFETSLRFGLDENNQGKLITSGIFSISRNPFFLSLNLYFLGTVLIFPSLFFLGFTVLAFISVHFFILKEEKFLKQVYGEKYVKYAEKVRRYF